MVPLLFKETLFMSDDLLNAQIVIRGNIDRCLFDRVCSIEIEPQERGFLIYMCTEGFFGDTKVLGSLGGRDVWEIGV